MNPASPPALQHHHAERWRRQPGLRPDLDGLADQVLPALREIKRRIVGLGAVALDPARRTEVAEVARGLADSCERCATGLREQRYTARAAVLAAEIVGSLDEVRGCAGAAYGYGLSAPVATALAGAYRDLRTRCAGLWPCELAFEGRSADDIGAGRD
jgi:hypothetical protein